jgi:DMSO/TMAO reductase YedYZ molybdopterin-dependent catalytic subunit
MDNDCSFAGTLARLLRRGAAAVLLSILTIAGALPQTPAAAVSTSTATIRISGDIAAPLELTTADLAKMPRHTATMRNENGSTATYEGVLLRDVLEKAEAPVGQKLRGKALASYVLAKASDGYEVVFALAEMDPAFANETILIADKRDGKAMSESQGPFKLICPNDKASGRDVRMLQSLEIVRLRK